MTRTLAACLIAAGLATPALATPPAQSARAGCPRNPEWAMWYSIAHPGLGEWYLNGWGSLEQNAPPKKFWLGFIPIFGWPGYLQVRSAIDARQCRTQDWGS